MTTDSPQMTCATCIWFNEGAPTIAAASRHVAPALGVGVCQYAPPQLVQGRYFPVSMFPETRDDRWCARWDSVFGDPDGGAEEDLPETNVVPFDAKAAA